MSLMLHIDSRPHEPAAELSGGALGLSLATPVLPGSRPGDVVRAATEESLAAVLVEKTDPFGLDTLPSPAKLYEFSCQSNYQADLQVFYDNAFRIIRTMVSSSSRPDLTSIDSAPGDRISPNAGLNKFEYKLNTPGGVRTTAIYFNSANQLVKMAYFHGPDNEQKHMVEINFSDKPGGAARGRDLCSSIVVTKGRTAYFKLILNNKQGSGMPHLDTFQ